MGIWNARVLTLSSLNFEYFLLNFFQRFELFYRAHNIQTRSCLNDIAKEFPDTIVSWEYVMRVLRTTFSWNYFADTLVVPIPYFVRLAYKLVEEKISKKPGQHYLL